LVEQTKMLTKIMKEATNMAKKRTLTLVLSLALLIAVTVGGTLAYLQDTDSDVNVMTLGNVDIEQHEWQRAENVAHIGTAKEDDLVPFKDGNPLYPAVPTGENPYTAEPTELFYWGEYVSAEGAGNGLWNDDKLSNVVDKIVTVENTGKSPAYYRTLIAFECPVGMEYSEGSDKEFMMNVNGNQRFDWEKLNDYIEVDGTRYLVMVATYNEVLAPDEISRPSLLQVVLTHNATNEDMELLGEDYTILVLSQAVQTAGFDNAKQALEAGFPGADDANVVAGWFDGVVAEDAAGVHTAEEFVEALENAKNGDTITLMNDIQLGDVDIELKNYSVTGTTEENGTTINVVEYADAVYTIDLNGHELSATAHAISLHGGTLNIKNGTISMESETQDGTFITVGGHSPVYDAHKVAKCGQAEYNPASVLNLENVTFEGSTAVDGGFATSGHAIYVTCHGQVHIRNCTFDLVMENGVYANPFDVYNNASDGVGDGTGKATAVYVYEGTKFYGDPTYQAWKDAVNVDWEVNGGYQVYIADGYKLEAAPIAAGDTYAWYTVVAE